MIFSIIDWGNHNDSIFLFFLPRRLRENKDLKTKQAKVAGETAKEGTNDKTLRNKAEKERRLREKNQNNTKKFIEERKIIAMKQAKEKEKLQAAHAKQVDELTREIQSVMIR